MSITEGDAIGQLDVRAIALEADALRRVPRSLALRHDILSLTSDGNQLTIALPDTADAETIDRVRLVTGMHVHAVRAPREAIRSRLCDAYGTDGGDAPFAQSKNPDEAPAIRVLDQIHEHACEARASDIHVEPSGEGGRVRQRIDGILCETRRLTPDVFSQIVSRVKLLAGMDIADRRSPQDGRYAIERREHSIDARVSSMPTIFGEKIVIRLLDNHAKIPSLERLGIPPEQLGAFRRLVHAPHGFVVACGPTGSGKTTTLYAALAERNTGSQNLCSIEDPVEIRIPGVAQVQINARAGVTFASALRAFLRQDPNVIMVGEMRDEETAAVAASASLSGQLLFTTLHSNDAPTAVDRLTELGVARPTIAAGLSAVVAQRLVRRLCEACGVAETIPHAFAALCGAGAGARVFRAGGCERCAGTGYRGRIAIFEFMFVDGALRSAIAAGASSVTLAELAARRGYRPMRDDGVALALAGRTSIEELERVLVLEAAA